MVARGSRTSNRRGFTLVELLIVVAIIGVLSTIGVPTFRRMIQKSKKSEAKVNLGGLYTSEQAFFSEYGGFGSNLSGLGFSMDGSGFIYTIGFPTQSCADQYGSQSTVVPASNDGGVGTNIANTFPNYYTGLICSIAGRGVSISTANNTCTIGGNTGTNYACFGVGQTLPVSTLNNNMINNNQNSTNAGVTTVGVSTGNFTASATGCVAAGCTPSTPACTSSTTGHQVCQDVWTINDQRMLSNIYDGVL